MSTAFFDAHLDLAYLAVNGRDMLRDVDRCGGPHPPAACTLQALKVGGVRACLGTVFTEASGAGAEGYAPGDVDAAHAAGVRQLEIYQAWAAANEIYLPGVRTARGGKADGANSAASPASTLEVGILIECADPVRSPDELSWWQDRGIIAIGLAWSRGSRYAAGNSEPSCSSDHGLTNLGRAMVQGMDALKIVHDLSHLSQRATDELLELTAAPVVATHSNCREILGGTAQRHLANRTIREIGQRHGVVGLNLFAPFVRHDLADGERPTISDALRHIEHVCEVMGHRRGVGLGSDLDGGFSADQLPVGIESPADFSKMMRMLAGRGWSEDEIAGFAFGNWARFWRERGVVFC